MRLTIFMTAVGAATAIATTAIRRADNPPPPPSMVTDIGPSFEDRYAGPFLVTPLPRPVRTERIVPVSEKPREPPPKARPAPPPKKSTDICRGKGKRWITKHKWRCRR